MAKTVVALYDNVDDAQKAVRELIDRGVSRERISLVANNPDQPGQVTEIEPGRETTPVQKPAPREGEPINVDAEAKAGAGIGAVLGGIGGLLVGLGALAIPGIGPVLAAGPLAAALGGVAGAGTGAIAGAAAGGLVGALSDMGVTEEHAGYYAEGIRRGGTLVAVQADDDVVDQTRRVMNQHHPVDINERGGQWRQTGWAGYETNPQPESTYRREETPREVVEDEHLETVSRENMGIESDRVRPGSVPEAVYDKDYSDHFNQTYASQGYDYDRFKPAYRYGSTLASTHGSHRDWDQVEQEARSQWQADHPDTPWDEVKDAIHFAWLRVQRDYP